MPQRDVSQPGVLHVGVESWELGLAIVSGVFGSQLKGFCMRATATLAVMLAVTLPSSGLGGQDRRVIRVSAERFAFTPSRIEIVVGEDVELRIKSDDTSHGFRLNGSQEHGAEINVTVPKRGRGEVVVHVRIDKPGRYIFECSRMCGAGHNFMRGELVVREPATRRTPMTR